MYVCHRDGIELVVINITKTVEYVRARGRV